jgi:sulfopyruvate decarboxylase alpha subunit
MQEKASSEGRWQDELYALLRKGGVSIFTYVPDAGHKIAIEHALADPDAIAVPLTSEQEGVALAAGAHLGGAKSVLLMQSSGAGNCINMLSLIENGRFPFLGIVTMRGDFGEANPWQYAMGQAVQPTLEALGVICMRAETPADVAAVTTAALSMAFQAERPVAILLSQRLIGAKPF